MYKELKLAFIITQILWTFRVDSYFCEVIFFARYENEMGKIIENVMFYALLFF